MKLLAEKRDYQGAALIADDINWNKVRNINTLCMVGRIYEHLNRTEDAKELYLMAYNRSPSSKNALYRLTRISIRNGNTQEAEMYFRHFSENAPRDRARYVLAYQISCMKDEPLEMRIAILEDLKKREFTEEWAYELAYLYYQAGQAENCVETCDELVLWFGEGEYVKKALELKRCFRPLSAAQEEKYKRLLESDSAKSVAYASEAESARIEREEGTVFAGPASPEDVEAAAMAEVQAALAEAVTEVETQMHAGQTGQDAQEQDAEEADGTDEENSQAFLHDSMIAPVMKPEKNRQDEAEIKKETVPEPSFEELNLVSFSADRLQAELQDAYNAIGAARDQETVETTIRRIRKMTVDLPFLQEAGRQAAQAFRNNALSDTVDENLLKNFQELKEEEQGGFSESLPEKVSDIGKPKIEDVLSEWEKTKKAAEEAISSAKKERFVFAQESALQEAGAMLTRLEEIMPLVQAEVVPEAADAWEAMEKEEDLPSAAEEAVISESEEDIVEEPVMEAEEVPGPEMEDTPESAFEEESEDAFGQEPETEPDAVVDEETSVFEAGLENFVREELKQTETEQQTQETAEPVEAEPEEIPEEEEEDLIQFSQEHRDLFAYFLSVEGMEKKLRRVVTDTVRDTKDATTSKTGNLIVEGAPGSGKTVLATSLIKVIQEVMGKGNARIGKISAGSLNNRDISTLLPKLNGGYLIIEKAGELTKEAAGRMSMVMEQDTKGVIVLLEDTPEQIRKALSLDPDFTAKFTQKVTIPVFGINELVEFGKFYAREMECEIDEMAVLAMYNRINNIRTVDHPTYLTEVKEIVDDAIISAERGSGKKGFGKIFAKRYNDEDFLILHEQDFEKRQ